MASRIWGGEYDLPGFVPRSGDRVADLGANVGIFSVLAAARGGRVTAIEPHPATFGALQRNTASWDVQCRQAAIVGRVPPNGVVELVEDSRSDTAHHLAGAPGSSTGVRTIDVPALAFADILAGGYDLIKMDVEGAEFEIFEHTPAEALARLSRLVGEVHCSAGDPEAIRARLETAGLTVTIIPEPDDPAHLLMTARR